MIYGVWLTTVDAVTVCTYPIPVKSFLCSNNPMEKFELKFFRLIFFPLLSIYGTRPSVRVHWVACGTCTVPDNFFQVGGSLRSHTRRGPLAHRSSHVRTTKQTCPCVICSSNSARYCFGIVYHCSAMVEVLGK